jgi:hypothetical protein
MFSLEPFIPEKQAAFGAVLFPREQLPSVRAREKL